MTAIIEVDYKELQELTQAGIDIMMDHFEDCSEHLLPSSSSCNGRTLFPRTISTGATRGSQHTIYSREDILYYCKASLYQDCRLNAYANYEELKKKGLLPLNYNPVPRHLMIDLDRVSFHTDEELDAALKETLDNIERDMSSRSPNPTIIWSGNGYHVHIPLELDTAFEDMQDFAAFVDPSVKFLRWAARRLTNGKADRNNNPSFRSMLLRVPGTINSKARDAGRDPIVRFVKIWRPQQQQLDHINTSRYRPRARMINDFHAYLVQEVIEKENNNNSSSSSSTASTFASTNGVIEWIEKLMQIGVEDNRKDLIFRVLAPYLITVRGLGHDEATTIIVTWLVKCDQVRRLQPDRNDFKYRIKHSINSAQSKRIRPPGLEKFKARYPVIYEKVGEG